MKKLQFTEFEVWQVCIPGKSGLGIPQETRFDTIPVHIVVGKTNHGFEALGEASRVDGVEAIEKTLRSLLKVPLQNVTPSTLWMKDAFETGFVSGMTRTKRLSSWEVADDLSVFLMESLWLDAVGKASGMPAHALLGGAERREVKVDFWAAQPSAQELRLLVAEAHGLGCSGMKIKSNRQGNTVFALAEIAQDIPEGFQFTIDPMFNWRSLHESRRIFKALEKMDFVVKIEDPFPVEAIEDWRMARNDYALSLIWHVRSEADLKIALREGVADAFNIACQSAHEAVYLSQVLAFHSKDCWFGSQLETGIFQQVRLHSASVAPTCVLACDLQSQWVREHSLVLPPMKAKNGLVEVSDEPGLGVELDRQALERYAVKKWVVQ